MRLVIDKKELELLLEQKKEYIGNQVILNMQSLSGCFARWYL